MQIQIEVVGKQIDIGDALREHVSASLEGGIAKYFNRPSQAHVTFSREGHGFRCDCDVHLDSGMKLQGTGDNSDIYASFETAAEHLEKRLRRYKRRLKDHHQNYRPEEPFKAVDYVIAPETETENEPEELQPMIIAETQTSIRTCTVGEAVMALDLGNDPMLLFRNSAHGGINVVYRRSDGNFGWVDPGDE